MFGAFSQLSDYQLQVQELVHDTSAIDFTLGELTIWINEARNRIAYDFHNVRYLQQNATLINNQEQYPIFGGVCGITINNPGNYPTGIAPTISIVAPSAGGVNATANCTLGTTNAVNQVFITNYGTLYMPTLAAPITCTFSTATGPGAVTATGTPQVETNVFDINSISVLWGIERYTMGWLPFTMFQAFCRQNSTLQQQPIVWSSIPEANIFFVFPIPNQSYLVDIDQLAYPTPLVNASDVDTQIIPPVNESVQFYGAYKALLKLQNYQKADYFRGLYDARVPRLITNKQDRRIPNIYRNAARRIARM